MGKCAWLFSWTEVGAQHVGIIQSLIVTCRLHGIDPLRVSGGCVAASGRPSRQPLAAVLCLGFFDEALEVDARN